eukprot:scaffold33622_cov51-Attheya_sp.AAC.6
MEESVYRYTSRSFVVLENRGHVHQSDRQTRLTTKLTRSYATGMVLEFEKLESHTDHVCWDAEPVTMGSIFVTVYKVYVFVDGYMYIFCNDKIQIFPCDSDHFDNYHATPTLLAQPIVSD